ncbi:DUF2478 domain-containing protein [Alterinioella nitratireducens]|uniref:DUF2478 domain-containing protein n=1 Tax=Alterinioella nitratireducens TaxID=2735915 RepID=UPI001555854F|nr:DUF2478 domain-containing protein [Alterinioella nitratireducens]NPD19313.1 DUF2478 domain-containing protein [Alterinioella nitratireducens]
MNIAYVMAEGRGDTDLLLADLADRLIAGGTRLCGTVQINTDRPDTHRCDMDVRVLPDGPTLRISQNLGAAARGCRLDPAALETAVAQAEARLAQGADMLIINKFGKHEADGRGFRGAIAEAAARGIPVLVGLNSLNAEAFHAFTAGLAVQIPADINELLIWSLAEVEPRVAA